MKYMVIFALMNTKYLKNILAVMTAVLISCTSFAQGWQMDWNTSVHGLVSSGDYMPFWARTGYDGIMPYTDGGLLTAGGNVGYDMGNGWNISAGGNFVGQAARPSPWPTQEATVFVDRLYLSAGWRMLHLDMGMKPRERELQDISISGGNVMYSRNARNIPGINAWSDWIYFEKGHWFGVKGNFAHYQMIDNRWVSRTMLHNKALSMKVALGRNVDFIFGFEHWAQWGGDSPVHGNQPAGLSDFIKIVLAQRGDEDATVSDQVNVLGNHLGKEYVRVDWRASDFTMTFQYDKPFEDGSGMKFRNAPDGIWSLQFAFNERERWVTDLIYEFVSTTWQTGPAHDRPATEEEMAGQDPNSHYYGKIVLGGCDNYFSNGEYKSGWTNYNRVIGCPLLLPSAPGDDGITTNIICTRVRAHHLGIKGICFDKVPYRLMATFSHNYGKYNQSQSSPFADVPWQLSLGLDVELGKRLTGLPVDFAVGVYGDVGELYQDSIGLKLSIGYKDFRRF